MKKRKKPRKFNLAAVVRAALRVGWFRYPPRREAIQRVKRDRGKYQCQQCDSLFKEHELQVDHVVPCGKLEMDNMQPFVNRMFCHVDLLRAVCRPCHKQLTEIQRLARKHRFEA